MSPRLPFDRAREAAEVPSAFDQDATSYDRLVGSNPGYVEHLRLSAQRLALPDDGRGLRLLDVGCGTGLSTRALLDTYPEAEIVAADASAEMLAQAREKAWPSTVRFVHSRAEELAAHGVDGPFDGILAAYLLRNLPDVTAGVKDLHALLAPGAPLAAHEYSVADSARSRAIWTAVCWTIIIPLGWRVTGDASLYRYLWRSVLHFDGVTRLTGRFRDAGFDDVRVEPVDGWQRGIVHTVLGRRPV
ncbi:class I SAM-dependent methyltransferase [Actinomycetospora sp. Odt1-22]|uniref:Class I SAM-dependent methyltransferase n=1 Tax=Actinomycetospora termitidis TaxID=3053470 RepID=A0ABT7M5J0_9PSEU|nr:class I SAM-dependent methyltransferase [Actinomycetospora sp. Odt1-22]MDL5154723.1 class I SAM-dependent methyltransferase [Actinomycetospora sp. Odt1-22]